MSTTQTIVLSFIQGITEFLPISSSGHLILTSRALGWSDPGLTFDLAVHAGTLLAVAGYFRGEWAAILAGSLKDRTTTIGNTKIRARTALILILVSNIPLAGLALALGPRLDGQFRSIESVGYSLLVVASVIFMSEKLRSMIKRSENFTISSAVLIMLAQSLAVVPGISRSGMTMSAAVATGIDREFAARYSFLLAAPAMTGAAMLTFLRTVDKTSSEEIVQLLLGTGISLATGVLSINLLMRYLRTHSFIPFGIYCSLAGLAVVIVSL